MMLCLIDKYGRTLKNKSITDLTIRFMKYEGLSKVNNISGGRLNCPKYLLEMLNGKCDALEIIFISNDNKPYKLNSVQKQKLEVILLQNSSELSGSIIKTLLLQEGIIEKMMSV